jgi:hypothetical protein
MTMTQNIFTVVARRSFVAALVVGGLLGIAPGAFAQIDPLLPVKRIPPNVVVVVDTSFRMLDDGNGDYYDPKTYNRSDDVFVANALGVSTQTYRRIYRGLLFDPVSASSRKYLATNISAVASSAATYSTFWSTTRFEIAKAGLAQAVGENSQLVRWGLMKLRQNTAAWRSTSSSNGCDKPVLVTGNPSLTSVSDTAPCPAGGGLGEAGKFVLYAPSVAGSNASAANNAVLYAVGAANATTNILGTLQATVGTGSLIPAGLDSSAYTDRPLYNALNDVKSQITSNTNITSDPLKACRNTVVVLIAGGKDDGDSTYLTHASISTLAGTYASLSFGGTLRRVPIVVIGVNPAAADETQLQDIAAMSGGRYFKAASPADVAAAVNYAVQLGFKEPVDFEAQQSSEYTFVSPIVGTVNLEGAKDSTGAALPDTTISSTAGATSGQAVPQRSNFLLVGGFSLPGFEGRLRAFRAFKPVADSTKPTGWKFVKDGTRLWPDLDDRPELAGMARVPFSSDSRNIYTFVPDGIGGGQLVAFTAANSATLAPHLGGADPNVLIPFVRNLPLGAIIGSTPAIMDPPSLDPPPDADYGFADGAGTFAATYKNRRSLIFFGANDGMVHAVDARTGYEVWAFIPYNLLPKLRTLLDGQPVEQFDYFVDSSPKLAEVKIGGAWRTILVIGEAYGGTFYQAFDITLAGTGVSPTDDGLSAVSAMLARFDSPGESIQFSWAFPNYSSFDPNINLTATLTDGFPGGKVRLFGDVKSSASNVEKRVGFTFSDPAVGTVTTDRSVTAVITGSGYFPAIETNAALSRGATAPAAGRALFLINAATGVPIGNASGSSCSGVGCYDLGDVSNGRKNALQADITASGLYGSTVVSQAYAGDIDGRYWKFSFTSGGVITASSIDAGQPIYSSSALLSVGTADRYLFFGTGSDFLNNTTPGGSGSFKLLEWKDGTSSLVTLKTLASVSATATDLPTNGERPTAAPTVAGDIVFFTTNTDLSGGPSSSWCSSDASSKLYAFTYVGSAAYDVNGNGKIDTNESTVVATTTGRGSAPFIVDQHLYISTTTTVGAGVTAFGDPEDYNNGVGSVGVRILSWREIR